MARQAHIIVLGNEKGGSGKSTTAVHIAVALLHAGLTVGAIDLDGRQRSLGRYLENRAAYVRRHGLALLEPETVTIDDRTPEEDEARLAAQLEAWRTTKDAIVIDCPGRDSVLSRAAHAQADTLITPLNDSFIDFDLLGTIDPDSHKVQRPSFYSELVWQCRKQRMKRDGGSIDWVVLRTRLSHLEARNMRRVGSALDELAKRIGFRVVPGLSERVIFRELFPKGLTLLDLRQAAAAEGGLTLSQVAARQEVRDLVAGLKLPMLDERRAPAADVPSAAVA
ncbi:division plane positioning ATPase MipZ [Parapedomonas caeni]